jgi:putative ABC transport system permease protein
VLRQLTVESLVLALVGGVAGVLFGAWALHLFLSLSPSSIPRIAEVSLDGQALAFTLGISVVTALLFGLAPAWHSFRTDLNDTLKDQSQASSPGTAAGRTRNWLVVGEVALSVVLLVAAGLMLQSFARLLRAERGFDPEHLLTAQLDFSVSGFTTWVQPTATRPQVPLQTLLERLRAYPGVQAVAAGSRLLRQDNSPPSQPFAIFGRTGIHPADQPTADFKGITPDWIRAVGGRLVRGRDFSEADTLQAAGVALVNESFARRFFPNEDPIGRFVSLGNGERALDARDQFGVALWSEIVGVVSDLKSLHPQPAAVPEVYRPYWQWPMQTPALLVRATGDPKALAAAIRRETKAIVPQLPAPAIRAMDDLLSESMAQPRMQTALLLLFAGVALVLASVGLSGVLACAVTQRTREIGIRMALGASQRSVLGLVLGQGMRLALAGIALGLLAALAVTRVMQSLLYGVRPTDAPTLAAVAFVLAAIALAACWLPARRAANVDPMVALRNE